MSTPIEWRPIPGHAKYEVSITGLVRSWKKYGDRPIPHLLKLADHNGYPRVQLSRSRALVHHLVLAAFVGPLPEGLLRRHIDGNSENNRLENLAYGTASENMLDRARHGTDANVNKTHCPQGHEYSEGNTRLVLRYGDTSGRPYRQCRECRSALRRKGYLRERAQRQAVDAANGPSK